MSATHQRTRILLSRLQRLFEIRVCPFGMTALNEFFSVVSVSSVANNLKASLANEYDYY